MDGQTIPNLFSRWFNHDFGKLKIVCANHSECFSTLQSLQEGRERSSMTEGKSFWSDTRLSASRSGQEASAHHRGWQTGLSFT